MAGRDVASAGIILPDAASGQQPAVIGKTKSYKGFFSQFVLRKTRHTTPRRHERTHQTPMELSASHLLQLAFALLFGVLLFVAAYTSREKWVVMFVVVLLPFQLITSPYGSSSTVLIYIVAGAALLKGRMKSRPFLLPFSFILLSTLR